MVCGEEGGRGDGARPCLQVGIAHPMPGLFSEAHTQAFPWVRKNIWASRYHEEELRGSSAYNGVDLSDPVVDFSRFVSDNESLVNKVSTAPPPKVNSLMNFRKVNSTSQRSACKLEPGAKLSQETV
ncbi:unnamed protein product [Dibothriocephalus latus]|uniref:Uncharacterized protein n=1 Tax=Dibothriocephalus latus TaxID=60516 RepID=A0A3P6PRW8_DIBLA|nr:unnamed protein product [Dibothriocephalus latus]